MKLRALFAPIAAVVLCACAGTPFDWDTARKVTPGMSEAQVTALLGKPYMVTSRADRVLWVWSYSSAFEGSKALTIPFRDGLVLEAPPIPATFR